MYFVLSLAGPGHRQHMLVFLIFHIIFNLNSFSPAKCKQNSVQRHCFRPLWIPVRHTWSLLDQDPTRNLWDLFQSGHPQTASYTRITPVMSLQSLLLPFFFNKCNFSYFYESQCQFFSPHLFVTKIMQQFMDGFLWDWQKKLIVGNRLMYFGD